MMRLVIAGNGFCGMMTAVHLIRNSVSPIRISLVGDAPVPGRGPAYITRNPEHLLNVTAAKMSCYPGQPGHFSEWLSSIDGLPSFDPQQFFAPRKLYGDYLEEVWNKAVKEKPGFVSLEIIHSRITNVEGEAPFTIHLENGPKLEADALVLATGNEIPATPEAIAKSGVQAPLYFNNPWAEAATADPGKDDILIVGNGLTMVDTVLSLTSRKFEGRIWSLSPHGFSMLPHRFPGKYNGSLVNDLPASYSLSQLFHLFRKHIRLAESEGLPPESVVDSLRPVSQQLWMGLSIQDKQIFMRHLRHWWGYARHRLPAEVFDRINTFKQSGRLKVVRGYLGQVMPEDGKLNVSFYNSAEHAQHRLSFGRIINCTGPATDITRSSNPLLRNLLERGLIRPDEIKLGIDTGVSGAVIGSSGKISSSVYALGNLLRGKLWETTAVPELCVQAAALADLLLQKVREQPVSAG